MLFSRFCRAEFIQTAGEYGEGAYFFELFTLEQLIQDTLVPSGKFLAFLNAYVKGDWPQAIALLGTQTILRMEAIEDTFKKRQHTMYDPFALGPMLSGCEGLAQRFAQDIAQFAGQEKITASAGGAARNVDRSSVRVTALEIRRYEDRFQQAIADAQSRQKPPNDTQTGGLDFAKASKQDKTVSGNGVQFSQSDAEDFLKSPDFAGLVLKIEAVRLK